MIAPAGPVDEARLRSREAFGAFFGGWGEGGLLGKSWGLMRSTKHCSLTMKIRMTHNLCFLSDLGGGPVTMQQTYLCSECAIPTSSLGRAEGEQLPQAPSSLHSDGTQSRQGLSPRSRGVGVASLNLSPWPP